jgi:uncharacterized PurR-regulated membrane protein YhhQ (DUF165 family)
MDLFDSKFIYWIYNNTSYNNIMSTVQASFRQDYGLILVGAIIFTASFMWKDLLSDVQEIYFPRGTDYMISRVLFTLIVTSVLIILAVHMKNSFKLNESNTLNQRIITFDDTPN